MNIWLIPIAIAVALTSGAALAAGNASAGKTKSAPCMACHGADGNSPNVIWPKLAGQHPAYIVKQLQAFKSGDRKDPLMSAQAAPLSDQDMQDLAAYFSSQKIQTGTAAADKVALGEGLYRGGNTESGVAACTACHGPIGQGNPAAAYPSIAGQHAAYVVKALKDFRAGNRGVGDTGKMMRGVGSKMTDAEIEAVAQYVQGLQN